MSTRTLGAVIVTAVMTLPMATGLTWPTAAWAQPAAQPRAALEEILVTARKREESSQNIPVAVSVFGADELQRRKVLNIEDLQSLVPNLLIDPVNFSANGAAVYIRGLGVQDIDRTFNPAVQVVIDGVTYGSSISNQMLNVVDVKQVEVLRGPQGTLFGANAIGGVINVTRRKPSGEFGVELEGTLGSESRRDFRVALEAPLMEGVLAGRLAVARRKNDGQFRNAFDGSSRGFENILLVSPQLLFTPSDDFTVSVMYDYYRDKSDWGFAHNRSGPNDLLCLGILFFPGEPICDDPDRDINVFNQDTETFMDVEIHGLNISAAYTAGDFTLESITGWSLIKEEKQTDFDGIPRPLFASVQPVEEVFYSQEFRVAWDFSDRLAFLGGVYGSYVDYQDSANSLFIFELLGFPPDTVEVVDKQQTTRSFGAFLSGDWQITDAIRLSAGGRFTYEEKDFIYRNGFNQVGGGFFPDAPGFDNVAPGKASWREFTPRVALEYRFTPDAMAYASYAQGFKSGGFNGRGNSEETIGPYDPEIVDTFEIGAKTEWLDNRLRINVAAFYSDFEDKQEEIIRTNPDTGATITLVDNAGEATMKGVELEWLVLPLPGLTLSGTLAYLDASYDEFVFDGFNTADFINMRRAPKWQYSVTGQYDLFLRDVQVSSLLSYRWTDDYDGHVGPRFDGGGPSPLHNDPRGRVSSFGTLDGSVSVDFTVNEVDFRVMLFGRNLTDKQFLTSVVPVANLFAIGGVYPGRFWGVELGARF
ncbi:MAG: TonB-dependent receptor [Gammaproteobacteria bacterium]|nr:MAG: TonB-dependent receptor [Gammaproteobacteria bacterium]